MKRIALVLALVLFAAPAMYAASWNGWITDEHCGAKGASADHKGCALKCSKDHGAALVFYNSEDQKIYKLDKQDLAKEHIGHEVTVDGTLADGTITVKSIAEKK